MPKPKKIHTLTPEDTNHFVKDTAKIWGISKKRTKALHSWVGSHVPPEYRGRAFTALLKRYQDSNKEK